MSIQSGNVLLQLKGIQQELTPVGKRLCKYILANSKQILSMSIHDLSLASKTSDAAVMRFCKTLGFEGYRAFIVGLTAAVTSGDEPQELPAFSDVQPGENLESIIQNISASNKQSISDTAAIINRIELEKAVTKLIRARRILFCGIGASALVCLDAEQKFMRIGKLCNAYVDGHSQLTAAALLEKQDVAVLISNSGETNDLIDTLDVLHANGVCSIAITRCSKSRLSSRADIVLNISTPEVYMRSGAMGSRIAMLNIIDILYATVVSKNHDLAIRNLAHTRKALNVKHG